MMGENLVDLFGERWEDCLKKYGKEERGLALPSGKPVSKLTPTEKSIACAIAVFLRDAL